MRTWSVVLVALLWASWGCDDGGGGMDASQADGGLDANADASMSDNCSNLRMVAPNPEGLQPSPCCYRKRNDGDPANAELRLTSLQLSRPASLANPLVVRLLSQAFQKETFNWLVALEGASADGQATVKTGYGIRSNDGTYRFAMNEAPPPGSPDRWNPITARAEFTGESFSTTALDQVLTVPILDTTGTNIQLELPLLGFELREVTLSEDRSCVGSFGSSGWDVTAARVRAFVQMEDAKTGEVDLGGGSTVSLCNVLAGRLAAMDNCEMDRATWTAKPDALCESGTCQEDPGDGSVCDPDTTCNAWLLEGGAAAHGVEVTNHPPSG